MNEVRALQAAIWQETKEDNHIIWTRQDVGDDDGEGSAAIVFQDRKMKEAAELYWNAGHHDDWNAHHHDGYCKTLQEAKVKADEALIELGYELDVPSKS